MSKLSRILEGWQNFISKSEVSEVMAAERATHCIDCRYAKKSMLTAFIKDDLKEIEGYKCNKCQCPLSAKLRSKEEKCPINLW